MLEAQVVAFSTTSSAATLPVNMRVAENKLGVSKGISSFVFSFKQNSSHALAWLANRTTDSMAISFSLVKLTGL